MKFYRRLKRKIYFIPLTYSLLAIILSLSVAWLDSSAGWTEDFPHYLLTSVELGKTLFSVLTGSLLTMITITFSTIMVVLTMYSGQFSPRVLQDFLENRITLRILGFFMGSFVYSIVSLFLVKDKAPENLIASSGIGVAISIICLILFAYFLNHVAKSIQINTLIERITREILALIESKVQEIREYESIRNSPTENLGNRLELESETIKSDRVGYIQGFDEKALVLYGLKHNKLIKTEKKIGEYVDEETSILRIFEAEESNEEEIKINPSEILQHVLIGDDRNREQDVDLGISKLVEMALRAISPGINDPNTAVFCIDKIGQILKKIGYELEKVYYYDDDKSLRLIVENLSFERLLYMSYYQIKNYGMKDVSVVAALVDSLSEIAQLKNYFIKKAVGNFSGYITDEITWDKLAMLDAAYLDEKVVRLEKLTGRMRKSV